MANVKNVILKKKIEGVIYDLLVKTNANLVEVEEGKTLATALTELTTSINSKVGTQEVENKIQEIVGAAPAALDTLKELADALGNDPDFAATITNTLAGKVDKQEGKGLSTEDFTTELKTKLENLTNFSGSADDVTETDTRKFVSPTEKATWNAKSRVVLSTTEPENLGENDIWIQEITE